MVELLRAHYRTLYFFPQMQDDYAYFRAFGWDDIAIAATTTDTYTRFLRNEDVDFIGTRLHGGIRAMQCGRRALIVAIDNRATEISRDTGLPGVARGDLDGIERWIEGGAATTLRLPQDAIDQWKAQFSADALRALARPASGGRFRRVLLKRTWQRAQAAKRLIKGLGRKVRQSATISPR